MDHQELLPIATDFGTHSMCPEGEEIHQSGHQMGVQQHLHQERG